MCTLVCEGLRGFYSSIRLTFVSWLRRSFPVGDIFFASLILRDPFLIGLSWLKLNVGHKIFSYMLMHGDQFISNSSKVYLSSSASPCQLHISSIYSNCLLQTFVVFKVQPSALRWNHRLLFYCFSAMNVQARLMSSLGPSLSPNMNDFIKTTKLPLSLLFFQKIYNYK